MKEKSLSCVRSLVTPWTAAYQALPSLGFSRQEHWSGLPFPSPMQVKSECEVAQLCPTPSDPMDCSLPGSSAHGIFQEGIGYPLQYSWASLVVQLAKNLPAMRETWVQSLGSEDPLEKGKATHSSILAWRIPWTVYSMGSQRVGYD